ncbi:putative bifunctional diguanylate cyclase/phosphodiesterase [Acetobacterium wieringae]|uniref:putative bifunctional diguanylate cyclase/phosphodiesterase n=1 Tax=Acetobacterium wieringae TaxID=52694 RepID=UPI0008788497|nr:bifunctional diguanylate cyclase/phosphodiesterase [Acetobacterium wieringae]
MVKKYDEKKFLILSFALFFLVMMMGFINFVALTQESYEIILGTLLYGLAFMGLFVISLSSNLAIGTFKKEIQRLKQLQDFDFLTGCPNWITFKKECERILDTDNSHDYAMVIFDIDKFKAINDLYGHQTGNEILTAIAKILEKYLNEEELFARMATDNFCILMNYEGYGEFSQRLENLIRKINSYSQKFIVSISMGIYLIGETELDINALSDRANMAKRSIKDNSQISYAFYEESMRVALILENEIENRMEKALASGEFEVYLQPKYLFSDEQIIGAEALVRWNDPERGMLPPNEFIPLFEKNGFVKKIDTYMFEAVCKLLAKWQKEMDQLTNMIISVNFSRLHLENMLLPEELLAITNRYQIDPKMIEIELTEGTIFNNDVQMVEIMNHLKDFGFHISIDDFGRAYSSLNTLKNLPADILKLDKAFFSESTDNARGEKIITSMLNMAKDLDLITVAEGVETREQVEFLKEKGCDIAQGFFYAKPMNVFEFEDLVKEKLKSA